MVVDSSVVAAVLIDNGPDGQWADELLSSRPLVAPHLLPVETVNVLRGPVSRGVISQDVGALAQGDLQDLPLDLVSYAPVAGRVWQLRHNLSAYDAWYVAVAESLGAPLATLDLRLARASGPRCEFVTPSR